MEFSEMTTTFDPDVWSGRAVQENFVELAVSGLASMYPASGWSSVAASQLGRDVGGAPR